MKKENERPMLNEFCLSEEDRLAVRNLLEELGRDPKNLEEESFLERAALLSQELPVRIRETFYEFKLRETSDGLLVTNNPIFPEDVGPTPGAHWAPGRTRSLGLPQILHGLYSNLLGEPFGFETQQSGRIFNDLIPIRGMQSNSSSGIGDIGLHTEDCAQPFMPDYLGLACLRNQQRAATTLSSLGTTTIPEDFLQVLFEEGFPAKNSMNGGGNMTRTILFGDRKRPYLRYGSIDSSKCSSRMVAAMRFISETLDARRQTVVLNQGDCVYLDNFVAVHGRAAYPGEYGPNGRWFCRLVMVRDLRRVRMFRASPESRVMLKGTY